jgi:WD40 repeat protein
LPTYKYDVFFSHKTEDKELLEPLVARLRSETRFTSWMDNKALCGGDEWWQTIQAELHASRTCAVFLGGRGWGEYHRKESLIAFERTRNDPNFRVIPVLLPGISKEAIDELKILFPKRHWVDLSNGVDQQEGFLRFVAAIEGKPQFTGGPPILDVHHIKRDAGRWAATQYKDKSILYFDSDLRAAQRIAKDHPEELNDLANRFLTVSALEQGRRVGRRIFALLGVIIALSIMTLVAVVQQAEANRQRRTAITESNIRATAEAQALAELNTSESQRLAFAAQNQLDDAPETAMLLAYEAVSREHNTITEHALRDTLDNASWSSIVFKGHTDIVNGAEFSPDGQYILTTSLDKTSRLWDLNGQEIATLSGVNTAVFTADGKFILTQTYDDNAQLWDLRGNLIKQYPGYGDAVLSPDLKHAVTRNDNVAGVWDLQGHLLVELVHDEYITSVEFSPDGQNILAASNDGIVRLWDLNAQELARFVENEKFIDCATFSPDGQYVLTESSVFGNGTLSLWSMDGKQVFQVNSQYDYDDCKFSSDSQSIAAFSLHEKRVYVWDIQGSYLNSFPVYNKSVASGVFVSGNMTFSPDGQRIVTASTDGTAGVWETRGERIAVLGNHTQGLATAIFSPDGKYILTASGDKTLRLWQEFAPQGAAVVSGHSHEVRSAVFSPDGQTILTASADKTARVWNLQGEEILKLQGHSMLVRSAVFSPTGKYILTASWDRTARLWDRSGTLLTEFTGHTDLVEYAVFSPDEQYVLTASTDHTAQLWDLKGKALVTFTGHKGWLESVAFSPDGKFVLTSSDDHTAKLWDLKGQLLVTFTGHVDHVPSAVFSPDGKTILTASADRTAILWDLQGKPIVTFRGHPEPLASVAFSPDGKYIATASEDKTTRLWNLQGQVITIFRGHTDQVRSVAFSPDGSRIITGSNDRTARIYLVHVADLLRISACLVGQELPEDERQAFRIDVMRFDFGKRECPPTMSWQQ